MSLYLIDNDVSQPNSILLNATSVEVGPISVDLDKVKYHVTSLPPHVLNMIYPFLENSSSQISVGR